MNLKQLLYLGFFTLICFVVQPASAQNKVITGRITDNKDKSALIGVSIIVKGSNTGTNTDASGSFRINAPASATTLVVSYIGYTSKEVPIPASNVINVSLVSTTNALNEVVVVGYGTQRIKDATGSVASLNPRDFNKGVIATPEQLLQGRISGVQVTPASGEPGAGATINIRGSGSIRSNNNPLYVVDGVPLDNGGTSGGLNSGAGESASRNPLAFLNPADIENISVLKDASASAIYGSRGANGVILITTRKGRKGQGIQFSANTSISNVAKRYDLLNRDQFLKAVASTGADATAVDFKGNTDWQKEIFRTGVSQNYNLGFGGASNTGNYRASFGYDDQNGTVKSSSLKRLTGRLNASQAFFKDDRLKFDLQLTASNVKNQYAAITNNAGFQGSLIGAVLQANPTYPVRDAQGKYFSPDGYNTDGTPKGSFRNPVALLNLIDDKDNINRYLSNISATFKIVKNLSYKGTYGIDNSKAVRKTFSDPSLAGFTDATNIRGIPVDQVSGNGRGAIQTVKLINQITEHTLTYDTKLKDNSSITALAGYSYQQFKNYGFNDLRYDTKTPNVLVKDINAFQKRLAVYGDSSKAELQSYFGRVNYSYQDKYLITATLRVDGSSKFGANNKYATFPALAFKWKLMNEDFAPKGIFDDLSLRINYGKTGNQEFPAYASLAVKQLQLDGSSQILTAESPNLKWETTTQYGAGIDFTILKGRLSGTIDYFNKATKDLLFVQDYAAPSPIPRRWVNLAGTVRNTGVEVGLNLQAVQTKSFNWEVSYNMTFLKNRIEDFGNSNVITGNIDGQGLSGAYSQVFTNGQPLASFKVPVFGGFDSNGLGIYPNGDRGTILGSPIPTFTAGLTNNFTFGKFNASFFLNGATGFYIYNNTANAYFIKGNLVTGRNVTQKVANSNENPLNSGEVSSRFLEKGNFLRLTNANIGYTFNLNNAKTIKSLRISVSGQNLFLITNYSGLDPEVNTNKARLPAGIVDPNYAVPSRGIDYTSYPSARTFTLSLNVGF